MSTTKNDKRIPPARPRVYLAATLRGKPCELFTWCLEQSRAAKSEARSLSDLALRHTADYWAGRARAYELVAAEIADRFKEDVK